MYPAHDQQEELYNYQVVKDGGAGVTSIAFALLFFYFFIFIWIWKRSKLGAIAYVLGVYSALSIASYMPLTDNSPPQPPCKLTSVTKTVGSSTYQKFSCK
jgi:hypothetical protein